MTRLCDTCKHGQVMTRRNHDVHVICHNSGITVFMPADIVTCSDYEDRRVISKYTLEKIAWTLNTDKTGQKIGFTPPKPSKGPPLYRVDD